MTDETHEMTDCDGDTYTVSWWGDQKRQGRVIPADWGIPTDGRIPALSLRQPWLWGVEHLNKGVENREKWTGCGYRGPLILHAAAWPRGDSKRLCKKPTVAMWEFVDTAKDMLDIAKKTGASKRFEIINIRMLSERRGGASSICDLVGTVKGRMDFEMQVKQGKIAPEQALWYFGSFALLLANVRTIPFVPCSGAPGLFGIAHKDYDKLELKGSP
jgi:hypothetical protein